MSLNKCTVNLHFADGYSVPYKAQQVKRVEQPLNKSHAHDQSDKAVEGSPD